jgi:hypothetical protein
MGRKASALSLEEDFLLGLQSIGAEASNETIGSAAEPPPPDLHGFMRWLGLDPSPVVAAIADASEGRRVTTLDRDMCIATFGCPAELLPRTSRRAVSVRAGGRGGKTSRLGAVKAIHAAIFTPIPTVRFGERAVAALVAPDLALATQALNYVRGYIGENPYLSKLVVEPRSKGFRKDDEDDLPGTATKVTLRRPSDGKLVDITIGAASRGGKSVRGRTLVFVLMDEACFFFSDDAHVVSDKEILKAAMQRLVPGGQVWMTSTPWIEGYGVLEEHMEKEFGKHETCLCATGGTRAFNPTWDPDGEIERYMRETDPENAAREIDAIPIIGGDAIFFPSDAINACMTGPADFAPADHTVMHWAGGDLGFTKNSSTMALAKRMATKDGLGGVEVDYAEEWIPPRSAPLKPSEICKGFALTGMKRGATTFVSDQHYSATAMEEFPKVVWDEAPKRRMAYMPWDSSTAHTFEAFSHLLRLMKEGRVKLPNMTRLKIQMRTTSKKKLPGGGEKICLPTSMGRSHGDLLMAVVIAVSQVPHNTPKPPKPRRETAGYRDFGAARGY